MNNEEVDYTASMDYNKFSKPHSGLVVIFITEKTDF